MAVNPKRLALALDSLEGTDWRRFEQFASAFLAPDYPNLRTVASASGDRGRDSELFEPAGDGTVKFQYSVRDDWPTKIRATARRLHETFADTVILSYVTNRSIGADADELKSEIRVNYRLAVDILDASYFVDRANLSPAHQAAAEALISDVVRPLYESDGMLMSQAHALSGDEAKAACVYLSLQREDDVLQKGLTKQAYEAIGKAVLRHTSPDRKLARSEIHERVSALLSAHPTEQVAQHVDRALTRMTGRAVRHYADDDSFCLAADERERVREQLELRAYDQLTIREEIRRAIFAASDEAGGERPAPSLNYTAAVRKLIERYLYGRGEAFVGNLVKKSAPSLDLASLEATLLELFKVDSKVGSLNPTYNPILLSAARSVLVEPSETTERYFRRLADAYTLFAFLRETPDMQKVVSKMFDEGQIWVDTNIVLRLMAEQLLADDEYRTYTNLLGAARDSGLVLHITPGVLEELEAHTYLSLRFARHTQSDEPWKATVPFLFSAFALTGRSRAEFAGWLELFRGPVAPERDIAEYLYGQHGISVQSLASYADKTSVEIAGPIKEFWYQVHRRRHSDRFKYIDEARIDLLVAHDVETFLGVMNHRKSRGDTAFGYAAWWFTLDRAAFDVLEKADLPATLRRGLHPPTISPDFLNSYLAVGPPRARLRKDQEGRLPLLIEAVVPDDMPAELIDAAERLRAGLDDVPELVVRRRVKDALNAARATAGPMTSSNLNKVLAEMKTRIEPVRKRL
jgi:hypothetical protein